VIYVDYHIGSKDLVAPLLKAGVPAQEADLGYADIEFAGRGPKGAPVMVGMEIKRLSELTADWERFAGEQVPKMQEPHYDHRWIVYEGEWRRDRMGWLQKKGRGGRPMGMRGQANASALAKKVFTLEMCAGFHRERTYDRAETVAVIADWFRWWTDEDMDRHKSHIVIYKPQGIIPLTDEGALFAGIPGISSRRARSVEKLFRGNMRLACSASVDEWAAMETLDEEGNPRRLGSKLATKIVRFLNGEESKFKGA